MENNKHFTHIDGDGKASMVDVSGKEIIKRIARAEGKIYLSQNTIKLIEENNIKKGDVLSVANLAGIIASKQTSNLIPLCHNINIDKVSMSFEVLPNYILARSETVCSGKTGIEMEVLTAVSVALLSIWDMCKAVDKNMTISDITLIEKIKEYQ